MASPARATGLATSRRQAAAAGLALRSPTPCVGAVIAAAVVLLIGLGTTMRAFAPLRRATAMLAEVGTGSLGVRLPSRGTGDPIDCHAETLNAVLERIDAGFERLRAFSSDVAHELRTPLNRMRNVTEVALAKADPEEQRVALERVEQSIDELFGLKPSSPSDLLAPDLPLGKSSSAASGTPGGVVDPLDILAGIVKPVPPPSVPDHGPELFTPYAPPAAKPDVVAKPEPAARPEPAIRPEPMIRPEPAMKPRADAVPPVPSPSARPAPSAQPAAPATQPVSVAPSGSQTDLLRAFLQGAGIGQIQAKSLTPDTMEAIGKLLREAVQGTLDLLRARGLTKSEMRADMTMIMARDNNPLKFSPTVEAALGHLLATQQVHGFMPPLRAMKDAYDDLRAHQLGFLAGMRAAIEEVLARFAPPELSKRLTEQSMLDDLLPMNRKAKLWDLFLERHAALAGEAREDFNAAFGKAFRRAYEAQVRELRGERK